MNVEKDVGREEKEKKELEGVCDEGGVGEKEMGWWENRKSRKLNIYRQEIAL